MLHNQLFSSFEKLETPFFYYDLELLQKTLDAIKEHGSSRGFHIHYALKANNNPRILKMIQQAGFGADCVSGNEVQLAIDSGFAPENIAFAGVGKTDAEIKVGLKHDIYCFNCESRQEIEVINELAAEAGTKARIALRLNPNVDARTHKYITTGLDENKFGINEAELSDVLRLLDECENIELIGIHFHIGSQIIEMDPFRKLAKRAGELAEEIERRGFKLTHINVGGGLGINYHEPDADEIPDFENYFKLFEEHVILKEHQQLHFEIGRAMVGQCGNLISRVLYIKEGQQTTFAIVDAGMSELIRPALYQAEHHIDVLNRVLSENGSSDRSTRVYDVVGPICESSDTFRSRMQLPELKRGDMIAIRSTGAYGEVMISNYNMRPKAGIIFSDDL
jgi:diaminopimelate decarboxylase